MLTFVVYILAVNFGLVKPIFAIFEEKNPFLCASFVVLLVNIQVNKQKNSPAFAGLFRALFCFYRALDTRIRP